MADYISQFTGSEIDSRLAKVPQIESALEGKQATLVSGTNIKTVNGQSVLGSGNIEIQAGDTDAVKYVSQTLTDAQKAQARANIDAASLADIADMDFVTATTLPTASASTMGHIYLIGPDANDNYDRYFTQESGGSYSWVSLGSTQIDLSTYATQAEVSQLEAKVINLPATYLVTNRIAQAYSGKMGEGSLAYRMATYQAKKNCKVTITYKRTSNSNYNGRYGIVDSMSELAIGQTPSFIDRFPQDVESTYTATLAAGKILYCMIYATLDEFSLTIEDVMNTVDTVENLYLSPDEEKPRLDFLFNTDYKEDAVVATSESSGRILQQAGFYDTKAGYNIAVYEVNAGEILHIKFAKVSPGVWQFQNTASMTTQDTTAAGYLVGTTRIDRTDDYVIVPTGATHLLVCQLPTNDNYVGRVIPLKDKKFSLIGKTNPDAVSVATTIVKPNTDYVLNVISFESEEKRQAYIKFMVRAINSSTEETRIVLRCYGIQSFPRKIFFSTNAGEDLLEVQARLVSGTEAKFSLEESTTSGIWNFNDADEHLVKLYDLRKRFGASYDPLTLLHFSDIHADSVNLRRILEYKNFFGVLIDDAIHTGDIVAETVSADSFDFWTNTPGADSVLQVIGNHDVLYPEDFVHDENYPYVTYLKPFIDGGDWGTVVQPTNAEANNLCYYYKDYSDKHIRLIVLDNFNNISVQTAWLADVLSDALANNLSVVIGEHYMPGLTENFDTGFNTDTRIYQKSGGYANDNFIAAVSDFINDGGDFVCWLTGHEHRDYCGVHEHDGAKQVVISVDCGALRNDSQVRYRAELTKSQDAFNVLSINPHKKTIQVFRVGNDYNGMMRHIGAMCIDYANAVLLNSF